MRMADLSRSRPEDPRGYAPGSSGKYARGPARLLRPPHSSTTDVPAGHRVTPGPRSREHHLGDAGVVRRAAWRDTSQHARLA